MATQMFKDMMAKLSHDDMVEECFEAVVQLRQLKQELAEERKEVERLKTALQALEAREQSFVKEIAYLTSRPLLCSVNTASGQKEEEEEEEEEVADVADQQVKVQFQKLQGLVRKRWLDDAMRVKNGLILDPLSNADMKAAAIQWVVHAANADVDEWASDDLYAWNVQHRASDLMFHYYVQTAWVRRKSTHGILTSVCSMDVEHACSVALRIDLL